MEKFLHVIMIAGLTVAGIVLAFTLFTVVFLSVWKPFGGKASRADRKDCAMRAANFDGKEFHNEDDFSIGLNRDASPDPLTFSSRTPRPDFEFPVKQPDFMLKPAESVPIESFSATWFGHSSLLVQMHGMNILIDPVFSEMISPVSFVGSRRYSHPPVSVADLPDIELLLLTHDHYDHLDYNVMKEIDGKVKRYVVPLGVENHLERWGVNADKIKNMAWWEEYTVDGLTIGCTPAQHFSGRKIVDKMKTLWCSYVLKDEYHQVFASGDSGFGRHFERIHEKYGDFDYVFIECGQYDVQWPKVHMFPEQSVQTAKILGARLVQPIHWGAIILSRHGWDDPIERFLNAAEKENLTVLTPYIGQTVRIETPVLFQERWWRREMVSLLR